MRGLGNGVARVITAAVLAVGLFISALPVVAQGADAGTAPAPVPLAEQVFVLSVGISQYKLPEVPAIRFAESDATAIGKLVTDRKIAPAGDNQATVKTLTGAGATSTEIMSALQKIRDAAGPNDLVIIYFATHRMRDQTGRLYLATYEMDQANLAQTAIEWRQLINTLMSIRTQRLIVLMNVAHFSQSPMAKMLDLQPWAFYGGKEDETLQDRYAWGQSAYAKALIEGLRGKADSGEKNGVITFAELNTYVSARVAELTGDQQHPSWPGLAQRNEQTPVSLIAHPSLKTITAEELTRLLEAGDSDIRLHDNTGRTLLHWAVAEGRADLVSLLLERGAEANAADTTKATPLHLAASLGKLEIADTLIAKGADLSARNQQDQTPLDVARAGNQDDMLDNLLSRLSPEARDGAGNTPLHLAALYGRMKVLQARLPKFANVNVIDNAGNTPLHLAAASGQVEVAQLLIDRQANLNAPNAAGATPLHLAVFKGQAKMATLLLTLKANANAIDKNGRAPLHWAAMADDVAMIDLLAARGASLNLGDKEGAAPLHLAVQEQKLAAVKQLLQRGANINVSDKSLYSPLHYATILEKPDILTLLIANRPNVNARDKDGYTPLHVAAWYNRVEYINALLKAGAQINEKNKAGKTPLALAKMNKAEQAMEALKQAGGIE